MSNVEAKCPIRYGQPCSLCVPGASGPQECSLVALVRDDPDLMELRHDMIEHFKNENVQQ